MSVYNHEPKKKYRVTIECAGEITSDEHYDAVSVYRAVGDTAKLGDYVYRLRDIKKQDDHHSLTLNDGSVIRAYEL